MIKDESDKANVAAKEAATKAAVLQAAAQQRYVTMRYYLDSKFVTDSDPIRKDPGSDCCNVGAPSLFQWVQRTGRHGRVRQKSHSNG